MPDPGFRKIIHEPTGNIAEVPETSLGQHYAAGWAPLDESREPGPAAAPAPPAVRAPAAKTQAVTETEYEEGEQA